MMSDTCIFCKIISGEIPATIVGENDAAVAFRDINPQAPVHLLIIPRQHIAALSEIGRLPAATVQSMLQLAADLAEAEGVQQSGYRLVTNEGPDSGQSVFHLHWHLLGGATMTNEFA
jgi:histidine triad (HIT) family protein